MQPTFSWRLPLSTLSGPGYTEDGNAKVKALITKITPVLSLPLPLKRTLRVSLAAGLVDENSYPRTPSAKKQRMIDCWDDAKVNSHFKGHGNQKKGGGGVCTSSTGPVPVFSTLF